MEMTGENRIAVPRETLWKALNDAEVLKVCIPGCESIDKTSDTNLTVAIRAKVGPVSAKFSGDVQLNDLDPPNGYTISGNIKGGVAGFARGGAKVRLEDDGDATLLKYEVTANVGGKLAQIGSRLIDSTAKKMADDFFGKFTAVVEQAAGTGPTIDLEEKQAPVLGLQMSIGTWTAGLSVAALILFAIFAF